MKKEPVNPKDLVFVPDGTLNTSPAPSQSTTVAKGSVAELTAREPGLAAELGEIGRSLREAGVKYAGSGDLVKGFRR
jgi:hypothetical protein